MSADPPRAYMRTVHLDATNATPVWTVGISVPEPGKADCVLHLKAAEDDPGHFFRLAPAALIALCAQATDALRYLPVSAAKVERALRCSLQAVAAERERAEIEHDRDGDHKVAPTHGEADT